MIAHFELHFNYLGLQLGNNTYRYSHYLSLQSHAVNLNNPYLTSLFVLNNNLFELQFMYKHLAYTMLLQMSVLKVSKYFIQGEDDGIL